MFKRRKDKSKVYKSKNSNIKSDVVITSPTNKTTQKPRKHRKRSTKTGFNRMYFTDDTEKAIIAYNNSEDIVVRNNLYNTRIKYAFEKLIENIFNTFKFSYFETGPLDVQKEALTHLLYNIHKFDPTRGFKAYSYFSIVAKNFFILLNNNNYKKFNQQVEIAEERDENTIQLQTIDSHYNDMETSEFMKLMILFWENNVAKIFLKQKDLDIANAVIELFRNFGVIDAFNKKILYLYIRDISNCKTSQITKIINKMKTYQRQIKSSYASTGTFDVNNYKKVMV